MIPEVGCVFLSSIFVLYYPAFIFGGIVYGSQMMWLLLTSTTQTLIYGAEPYNFSANGIGLTNLGCLVGSILGTFYGGKFVDWLSIRLAKKQRYLGT